MSSEFAVPGEFSGEFANPDVKHQSHISLLYDQLMAPRSAAVGLADRRPYWIAALVILLAVVSQTTGKMLMGGLPVVEVPFFILACIAQVVMTFVILVVCVGIYHLAATHDDALGDARVLFLLIASCLTPQILLAPLALIARGIPNGMVLWISSAIAIAVWVFVLKVLAIRNYYGISGFKAFLVILLPFILAVLFFIPLMVLIFGYVIVALKGLMG